jgi:NADH-quinone oxidoreductase subunit L
VIAGFELAPWFIGHDWPHFWNASIVNAPSNHVMDAMHHVPEWVSLLPTILGLAGIALALAIMALVFRLATG